MSDDINYILICLIFIAFGMRANWYFIAKENSSLMTKIDVIASILLVILLYILKVTNVTYVLILLLIYRTIPTIIHFYIITELNSFKLVSISEVYKELKTGLPLFIHIFSVSFYSTFNSLYLGLIFPSAIIINYINAEKLNNIAIGLFYPIVNSVIPRVMEGNQKAKNIGILVIISYSLLCIFGVYLLGDWIITLIFSDKYINSVHYLKVLCFAIPLVGVNYIIGQLILIPMGLEKLIAKTTVIAGIINVILLLYITNYLKDISYIPYLVIFIEGLIMFMLTFSFLKIKRVRND
ncbi:hypothetical protein UB37_15735 [Photobacterium iliopiscarium]|nr:hypothetical protein [Photobacterium iliopiscarium]KJG19985.1 hypothetical protein UB37_15735 [Photobacterium iliopiscarium]